MALSPARGCSVLVPLLLLAVVAAAAPAMTAADSKWAPRERHGAHSHKAPAAAPAAAPPTPAGLYPPHGTAAAAAPGPVTPPQGAVAPAPSPDYNGGAAAVPFAWPTVLLVVAAGVAAATMIF